MTLILQISHSLTWYHFGCFKLQFCYQNFIPFVLFSHVLFSVYFSWDFYSFLALFPWSIFFVILLLIYFSSRILFSCFNSRLMFPCARYLGYQPISMCRKISVRYMPYIYHYTGCFSCAYLLFRCLSLD